MGTHVGFSAGVGQTARPDGLVAYRVNEIGQPITVYPATCKRQLHLLSEVGYTEVLHEDGIRVSCDSCRAKPDPDHMWWLETTPSLDPPVAVELDDEPYRHIKPRFIARRRPPETPHHGQPPAEPRRQQTSGETPGGGEP